MSGLTDVAGLKLGHAQDNALKSGVSVVLGDAPFTAGVHVMGGAPGTRETDLLAPDRTVEQVDALVLSGGSGFGLSAGDGVADGLRRMGRGFDVGGVKVPIVPGAILFDLLNGGDKDWDQNPYHALGLAAFHAASTGAGSQEGTVGAGTGATTATLKGGLGQASTRVGPFTVSAMAAVNALGSATVGRQFWAAPWEVENEFGGLGPIAVAPDSLPSKLGPLQATTIAIVATDARLTKPACTRMATAAHDGMARSLAPSHTPLDGDLVFAAATGLAPEPDMAAFKWIGHAAATCLARAIARGVYHATPAAGDTLPCWQVLAP